MEFIREKIKEKPLDKKNIVIKIGVSILCGFVFAITAFTVFVVIWKTLGPIIIKKQEQEQDTETQEIFEIKEGTEIESQTSTEQQTIFPNASLSLTDYQSLQNELYAIGNKVNQSLVTITGIMNEKDSFYNVYEQTTQGTGVIISEDEQFFYILTEKNIIFDVSDIQVTLTDGTNTEASILKQDKNIGIVILTISKNKLKDTTKQEIAVAKIGNSNDITKGTIVIALGSFFGTNDSIVTGNIISTNNKMMALDKNYAVLTTNIVASKKGSGILINTNGEIVGMITQEISNVCDINTLTAVGISEISETIQALFEEKSFPYIGLYVSTVTDNIAKTYDIPKGVFIKDVATDSPAMKAGLQSGDVIMKINGEKVETDTHYSAKMSQLVSGTICEMLIKRQNGEEYYNVVCQVEIGILE